MMSLLKHTSRTYILYSLSCLVIITASITFILSLYRLQRDSSLLNRERKRDYVTNKINKSFPTIAIIISIIVCLSAILCFVIVLINGRTEMLITSIVSNIILGIGLIVLGVIMLGFVQNIVDNFPVDIERLLVDFIIHNSE
jgi:amino acid transporter